MHNNTIKINLFQIKYIDYMSIKMGSVYELLKSIRKTRNSPGRPGILVESTRTLLGIPGFLVESTKTPPGILVGKYQDFTRTPPGLHQESWYATRNLPGILVCNQESTRNPGMQPGLPGILQEYMGQWKVLNLWPELALTTRQVLVTLEQRTER